MDLFIILTIVFFCITTILILILFKCRSIIVEMFGRVRNWFLRNYGYGYVFFYEPNKRVIPFYTKLNDTTIKFQGRTYANIPEAQFDFRGIRTILYNINDANPVRIIDRDESDKMQNNAKFWDNFASLIKLYEQSKASAQQSQLMIYVLIALGGVCICILISGYNAYQLTQIMEAGASVVGI